jgi:hypothetical protein
MKKQILIAFLSLVTTSLSLAAPITSGDVKFQDDQLVILNQHISCSASSVPVDDNRPETVVFGTFTSAMTDGKTLNVSGFLDGDLFNISGNVDESMKISLQEYSKAGNGKPSYSFSSSGLFTNLVVHGTQVKKVSLNMRFKGKAKNIVCSIY